MHIKSLVLTLLFLVLPLISCSGGGGGGQEGATRDTAVRIIHGSLDATPVSVIIDEEIVQTSRFSQSTSYVTVERGEQKSIIVERATQPGNRVAVFRATLDEESEYTIFLSGGVTDDTFSISLLTDIVDEPEEGRAFVQVLHSFIGSPSIQVLAGDVDLGLIRLGATTGFFDIPSGLTTFSLETVDGSTIAAPTFEVPDKGELTILLSGSKDLGAIFTPLFLDLD